MVKRFHIPKHSFKKLGGSFKKIGHGVQHAVKDVKGVAGSVEKVARKVGNTLESPETIAAVGVLAPEFLPALAAGAAASEMVKHGAHTTKAVASDVDSGIEKAKKSANKLDHSIKEMTYH